MGRRTILVVDDEPHIRDLLKALFQREGFAVTEAADGAETLNRLEADDISLVTLDVGLADEDGFALAREIRMRMDVPIVMISAKADEVDRIVGLELGADDYIVKPFNPREVLARIRAVLRRYEPRGTAVARAVERGRLHFDGWQMDLGARQLLDGQGVDIELTTAEFNLLTLFVERPQRVLSRERLLDLLKGQEWSPYDRSIDTLVARLRKKIEKEPDRLGLVKTVRGVGYVFTAEVTRG